MGNPGPPPEQPLWGSEAAGQPGYGQPGYGQQFGASPYGLGPQYSRSPYGPYYGAPARELDQYAIISLVLAALAWAVCPIVLAVVALVLARLGQRAIDGSGGAKTGDGLVKAARILSWLNIVVFGFLIAAMIGAAILGEGYSDPSVQY